MKTHGHLVSRAKRLVLRHPVVTVLSAMLLMAGVALMWEIWGRGSVLYVAARDGDVGSVGMLLAVGTKTTYRNGYDGRTALHAAVAGGHVEVVRALIDAGADVNARDKGYAFDKSIDERHGEAPLHLAAELGHAQIAKLLLEAGAEVDAMGSSFYRDTPLGNAVRNDHLEVTRILLRWGADPLAKDWAVSAHDLSPYDIAINRENTVLFLELAVAMQKTKGRYVDDVPGLPSTDYSGVYFDRLSDDTFVTSVKVGGVAEKAGLREGDLLLEVDEMDVRSFLQPDEIKRLIVSRIKKGNPVKLLLKRGTGVFEALLEPDLEGSSEW